MKITLKQSMTLLGTGRRFPANIPLEATPATNQPEPKGKYFVNHPKLGESCSLLVEPGDYYTPEELEEMELVSIIYELLIELQPTIADDYRATDDPDDTTPGMQVTVGADREPGEPWSWSYQTGDNSFSGGAYHFPHWGVGYFYRDSDCREIAESMAEEILESMAMAQA